MHKSLEEYLESIDHYLIVNEDKNEILEEIRDHILEKTEAAHGEISEENIKRTISSYGSAQQVAERYIEGFQIISPAYKNYLFRYTWLLFALHYFFKLISYLFGLAFHFSPFGFPIRIEVFYQLLSEAPATWIYSFGIVALVLYFITQSEKEINLIWPQFAVRKFKIKTVPLGQPSKTKIVIVSVLLIAALYIYSRYGTVFFMTFNLHQAPFPMFTEPFSRFISLLLICLFAFELICTLLLYFIKTYWINIINNLVYLAVAVFLLRNPFENILIEPELNALKPLANFILIASFLIAAWELFKALISMLRSKA